MMKKIVTISCLVLAACFTTQQAQAQIDFGVRGGVNFASFNDASLDVSGNTGFMGGFYVQYPIANSPIVIQPEILYSQKGAEYESQAGTVTANLNYIEIPVLAKFNYVLDGPLTPYVAVGPYVGFLIDSSTEYNGQDVSEGLTDFKTVDFGVAVGAGINYKRFNLGVRYDAGLTTISDADDASAKNGAFAIIAGFSF